MAILSIDNSLIKSAAKTSYQNIINDNSGYLNLLGSGNVLNESTSKANYINLFLYKITEVDDLQLKINFRVYVIANNGTVWIYPYYNSSYNFNVNGTTGKVLIKDKNSSWKSSAGAIFPLNGTSGESCPATLDITFNKTESGKVNISVYSSCEATNQGCPSALNIDSGSIEVDTGYPLDTAPSIPQNLTASPNNFDQSITVSWDASTIVSGTISGYDLDYSTNGGSSWSNLTTTTNTSYEHTPNINDGAKVRYRVRCYSTTSKYSDFAESGDFYKSTPPNIPPSISVDENPFNNKVTISWEASTISRGSLSAYQLQYSTDNSNWVNLDTDIKGTSYKNHEPNINNGDKIYYRVRAYSTHNKYSGYRTSSAIYKSTPPDSISSLSVNKTYFNETTELVLSWSKPSITKGTVEGYKLRYKIDNGNWTDLTTIENSNTLKYTVKELDINEGSKIQFAIRSYSTHDKYSGWTYSKNCYRIAYPNNPNNFTIDKNRQFFDPNDYITLKWDDPTSKENCVIKEYIISVCYKKSRTNSWSSYKEIKRVNFGTNSVNINIFSDDVYNKNTVYTGRNLYCFKIQSISDKDVLATNVVELDKDDYLSENFVVFSKNVNRVIVAKRLEPELPLGTNYNNSITLTNSFSPITKTFNFKGKVYKYKKDDEYYYKAPIINNKISVISFIIDDNESELKNQSDNIIKYIDSQVCKEDNETEIFINNEEYEEYFLIAYLNDYPEDDYSDCEYRAYSVPDVNFTQFVASIKYGNYNINYSNIMYHYKIDTGLKKPILAYSSASGNIIEKDDEINGVDVFRKPIYIRIGNYINNIITIFKLNHNLIQNDAETKDITVNGKKFGITTNAISEVGNYRADVVNYVAFKNEYGFNICFNSETASIGFYIDTPISNFILPTIDVTNELIENNTCQKATATINIENDNIHAYKIELDGKDITTSFGKHGSLYKNGYYYFKTTSLQKVFDNFTNVVQFKDYNLKVYVINSTSGISNYIEETITIFKISKNNSKLINKVIYHDSIEDDPNNVNMKRCNDVIIKLETPDNNSLYVVSYNGKVFVANGEYNILLLDNDVNFSITEYFITERNHYHKNSRINNSDIIPDTINDFTNTETNSSHLNLGSEKLSINIIDQTVKPEESPKIKVNYTDGYKLGSNHKYNETIKINGTTKNIVYDEYIVDKNNKLSFSILQENPKIDYSDYDLECYIDGKPYTLESNFDTTGAHVFHAFYKDRHNYTISSSEYYFRIFDKNKGTVPFINYEPKTSNEDELTITINWWLNESDEKPYILKKEYKIDNGEWKTYKSPFKIYENCTIYARKTLIDFNVLESSLTIEDLIDNTPPDIPVISDFIVDGTNANSSIYIPAIDKVLGCSYEFKINGLNYIEGTPITNYDRNIREFLLEVKVTNNYNNKSTILTKSIKIDTVPPNKPILSTIQDESIVNIDKNFTLKLDNYEDNVEYSMTLNGKDLKLNKDNTVKPFVSEEILDKSYILIISAKKKSNGMSNSSFYYFDINNYETTDEMHTIEKNRNVLIPSSIENGFYEYPKEFVVDERTGDLCIVSNEIDEKTNGYKLINMTKDIKEKIYDINNILGQYLKMDNIHFEQLRYLRESIEYINENNDILNDHINNLNRLLSELENEVNDVNQSVNETTDKIDTYESNYNEFKEEYENSFKSLMTILSEDIKPIINNTKNSIKTNIYEMYDNASEVIKLFFNLESIEMEANTKISKKDFEAFEAFHNAEYKNLKDNLDLYVKAKTPEEVDKIKW